MADGSVGVFIKRDPDEHLTTNNPNNLMMSHSGFTMPNNHVGNQFGNSTGNEAVDPSELTMQSGGFMGYSFGSQQNVSSSYNFGNSGIDTDELLDLEINGQNANGMNFLQDPHQTANGMAMNHAGQMSQMYSNTPEGAPIQSPFIHGSFNYEQFRPLSNHHHHHSHQTTPSHMQGTNGQYEHTGYINAKPRPSLSAFDRTSSDGRSPMTPKTPALAAMTLGTPESGSFPPQPIRTTGVPHRHQKTMSSQWDGTPGSAQSYMESPISSPGHPSHHVGISEILKSGKHASMPAKVDAYLPGGVQDNETQEAKRRRRRASHNLVERRRRDNINDRIQDLSRLVPQHLLEDDRVRKQLVNNSTFPAAAAAAGGPGAVSNAATSLLAGGNGRRAVAGNITMGLPMDDKEKGPNKGDILNGAVGWMRDLMWALHVKMQQESELAELISSLGGTWPFEQTEEEKRMRSEVLDAMEKNDSSTFSYSRAPGSGLRVPKHTNLAGDSIQNGTGAAGTLSPQSLSPAYNSGASSTHSGGQTQPQYWNTSGHAGMSFKEEDEYDMELN